MWAGAAKIAAFLLRKKHWGRRKSRVSFTILVACSRSPISGVFPQIGGPIRAKRGEYDFLSRIKDFRVEGSELRTEEMVTGLHQYIMPDFGSKIKEEIGGKTSGTRVPPSHILRCGGRKPESGKCEEKDGTTAGRGDVRSSATAGAGHPYPGCRSLGLRVEIRCRRAD